MSSGAASDLRDKHVLGDGARDPAADGDPVEYFVERTGDDLGLIRIPMLGEELHLQFGIRIWYCLPAWDRTVFEAVTAAECGIAFGISEGMRYQIRNAILDAIPGAGTRLDQTTGDHLVAADLNRVQREACATDGRPEVLNGLYSHQSGFFGMQEAV